MWDFLCDSISDKPLMIYNVPVLSRTFLTVHAWGPHVSMDSNLAFTSIKFKARVINKQTLIHTMQYVCIAIHDRGELGYYNS